jgi:hypothetical protein
VKSKCVKSTIYDGYVMRDGYQQLLPSLSFYIGSVVYIQFENTSSQHSGCGFWCDVQGLSFPHFLTNILRKYTSVNLIQSRLQDCRFIHRHLHRYIDTLSVEVFLAILKLVGSFRTAPLYVPAYRSLVPPARPHGLPHQALPHHSTYVSNRFC